MKWNPIIAFVIPAAICAFFGGALINRSLNENTFPRDLGLFVSFITVFCGLAAIVLPLVSAIREQTENQMISKPDSDDAGT